MKSKSIFLLSAVFVLVASSCLAGTVWHYKCESPKCHFEGDLWFGGGFEFDRLTGYCWKCKKFVSFDWKTKGLKGSLKEHQDKSGLPDAAPEPVGIVWSPALATALYRCPNCKQPIIEIRREMLEELSDKHEKANCPHCHNRTLTFTRGAEYD